MSLFPVVADVPRHGHVKIRGVVFDNHVDGAAVVDDSHLRHLSSCQRLEVRPLWVHRVKRVMKGHPDDAEDKGQSTYDNDERDTSRMTGPAFADVIAATAGRFYSHDRLASFPGRRASRT